MNHLIRFSTVAIAGVMLAACGGGSSSSAPVGGKNLERDIHDGIKQQQLLDMDIDCPKVTDREKGASFSCTATTQDGRDFKVRVTQKDDKGNVTWSVKVLSTKQVETDIEEEVYSKRNKLEVTVVCPDAVKLEAGYDFTCTAKDAEGNKTPVEATVKDDAGNVTWKT